jgi:V/A-type H+-transporting ATPase subunit E
MKQSGDNQLVALEAAIMTRAEDLAEEFHDKAKRQRDAILRDAAERLHLAEEREVLIAKAEAERHFRRVTQARELKLQGRLDQLRWEMVQTVQSRLADRMRKFCADRPAYRAWLVEMLRDATDALPAGELTAEVNSDDHAWMKDEWSAIASEAAPERQIELAENPTWGEGGIKIRTADNRAQVDNRFDGRLRRFESEIQREILQQLFPGDLTTTSRNGGSL